MLGWRSPYPSRSETSRPVWWTRTISTGIIDVGRLGVADRHHDLALLTRSAGDAELNPAFAALVVDLSIDPWRLEFYRLLDELF